MDIALQMSTGLKELDRKLVVYWTIATHMLPNLDTFPLLVLRGQPGTGKSECLKIVSCFARNPRRFTVGSSSFAAIRDEFAASYEGTAIIEEADQSKDGQQPLERFLSDRYQRNSSQVTVKEKLSKDTWGSVNKKIFGATAIHRRVIFSDAALDGRSVSVLFRRLWRPDYMDSGTVEWIQDGYTAGADLSFKPVDVEKPDGVLDRIYNTYRPLLVSAAILGDSKFPATVLEKMEVETQALIEAQSYEHDGLVLRAILALLEGKNPPYPNIRLSVIVKWLWDSHRASFDSRKVGSLARTLGFSVKESHGTAVLIPTPAKLLKACYECGYDNDEELAELRRLLLGGEGGGVGQVE